MAVKISIIVARALNGVIGAGGGLPWRLKDDLAFFRRTTLGAPVIMGRRTWESLPRRPLPGRQNIVLTRDPDFAAPGALLYTALPGAVEAARAVAGVQGRDEAFIIGGAQIYEQALALADRIYMTQVEAAITGDAFFPGADLSGWTETGIGSFPKGPDNSHPFSITRYDRP